MGRWGLRISRCVWGGGFVRKKTGQTRNHLRRLTHVRPESGGVFLTRACVIVGHGCVPPLLSSGARKVPRDSGLFEDVRKDVRDQCRMVGCKAQNINAKQKMAKKRNQGDERKNGTRHALEAFNERDPSRAVWAGANVQRGPNLVRVKSMSRKSLLASASLLLHRRGGGVGAPLAQLQVKGGASPSGQLGEPTPLFRRDSCRGAVSSRLPSASPRDAANSEGGGGGGGGRGMPPPSSLTRLLRYGGPILPALPIGVASGSLGSVVGIGGALLMVPTVSAAYGLKQLQANSTALLPNVATCAVFPTFYILNPKPQTPKPKPFTLNLKPQTPNPKSRTLNPKSQTLNPKP